VCRCGGIQSNNVTKQCLAPLAWQTGPVGYFDVLHNDNGPATSHPVSGIGMTYGRIVICGVCRLPVGFMCQLHATGFGEHKYILVLAWCPDLDPFDGSSVASSAWRRRQLQFVDVDLDSTCQKKTAPIVKFLWSLLLRATVGTAISRLSHRNSVCLSVPPSVRLSVTRVDQS